jgi:hypothetical protein
MDTNIHHVTCPYSSSCHFFSIANPTPHTEQLWERYCMKAFWACEIFSARKRGRTITITMTPEGR